MIPEYVGCRDCKALDRDGDDRDGAGICRRKAPTSVIDRLGEVCGDLDLIAVAMWPVVSIEVDGCWEGIR